MRLAATCATAVLLLACDVSMDPDALRPSLTQAALDPVVLAALCGTEPGAVTPVSASGLTLSSIAATRPLVGSDGRGTAELQYRPLGGAPESCRGRMSFAFSDDASAKHFTVRDVAVERR